MQGEPVFGGISGRCTLPDMFQPLPPLFIRQCGHVVPLRGGLVGSSRLAYSARGRICGTMLRYTLR